MQRKFTKNILTMCISEVHYLVYYHGNILPLDNVDQCYRIHATAVDMSETQNKHLLIEHRNSFRMTFQDGLIEWLSNKSDFHTHLLSAARRPDIKIQKIAFL